MTDASGRRRDRRRRAGRRRAGRPAGAAGEPGRRPRASAGLALAGGWRVHVAGRGRGAAACRSRAATLAAVARPIPAMRVETLGGTTFRLTYGADDGGEPAVGFDRSRLDPALLELADVPAPRSVAAGTSTAVDPDGRPARGPPTGRTARPS